MTLGHLDRVGDLNKDPVVRRLLIETEGILRHLGSRQIILNKLGQTPIEKHKKWHISCTLIHHYSIKQMRKLLISNPKQYKDNINQHLEHQK